MCSYFILIDRLQYGANARYCESTESNTALHLAAQAGNVDFMKILIQYGADINAVHLYFNIFRSMKTKRLH